METAIRVRNLYKYFNGNTVLKSLDFTLNKEEIHALIGKNGAGKTTFIKIITGIYKPDLGEIYVGRTKVNIKSPYDSLKLGISAVHQELNLFDDLTVAENIYFNNLSSKYGMVNQSELYSRAKKLCDSFGINLDIKKKIRNLSMGEKHFVALARVLSQDSKIIIMDEITSALTVEECNILFNIINILKSKGYSILYVTHNISEIYNIVDKVSVLRDGEIVETENINDADTDSLARSMVGKELKKRYPKLPVKKGEKILHVENLTFKNFISDISFSLRKGEILGITGLMGSGRSIVAKTLFGIYKYDKGKIFYNGKEVNLKNQADAVKLGICYIPEDRMKEGILTSSDIKFNISIAHLGAVEREKVRWMVDNNIENERIMQYLLRLGVSFSSIYQPVVELSSGNQQKILIARWLLANSNILIMDEPTKDLDIASKVEVYNIMNELVREGKGIIFVSSDFTELTGMCDRVVVLKNGRISKELKRNDATKEKILKYAL